MGGMDMSGGKKEKDYSINLLISRVTRHFLTSKKRVNTSRRIAAGFLLIILIGALILMLPISSKERVVTPFLTALFTTTSATCVTGLTLVDTGAYYSLFGQAVILILIQFGGLGFMTIFTTAFIATNKQIGLRNRMTIAQSLGVESLEGVVRLVKLVLKATLIFEAIGAAVLAIRFIPQFGILRGLWYSVFHSVSAFCNAGFDVLGNGDSMMTYQSDPLVMLTLGMLVIIGGLGFVVWEDTLRAKKPKNLSLYSKLVFIITAILFVCGAIGFFAFEKSNPATIGNQSLPHKILSAIFQSITTRTAGFDSIGQANMTQESKLLSIVLMMIGGASGSTAGGVKIITVATALMTLGAVLSSKNDVIIFGRKISQRNCMYALTLVFLWMLLILIGGIIIGTVDKLPIIDVFYETASAYGTVGLTDGVTAAASLPTKILLMIYMFFGRVGIMTISVTFTMRSRNTAKIDYPEGHVLIG
jgi:trk system potassium uptake protein TrkH